jgi:hypothetical protein
MTVTGDVPQPYSFRVGRRYQVLRRGTGATSVDVSDALPRPFGPTHPYMFQDRGQAQSTRDRPCGGITMDVRLDSEVKSVMKVGMCASLQSRVRRIKLYTQKGLQLIHRMGLTIKSNKL